MALWAGRFKKEEDSRVNDFNSSIRFDFRMYKEDIEGSIAHATMLEQQKIISADDYTKIVEGLSSILDDIASGGLLPDSSAEDIHMFVEAE
ncbi:MAG: argininosuccinate lyase, partial [Hydrogenoanaerobacterium sp.]